MNHTRFPDFNLHLPEWINGSIPETDYVFSTIEERMQLIIKLSRLNIEVANGGPFGAGIFNLETKKLLAPGVNMVLLSNCSIIHAEIMAIMIAQQIVHSYDLGDKGMSPYELITSTEPCAMCLGAICWSGIRRLVCAAREEDALNIGFDEGPKPSNWIQSLENRGITVVQDICRNNSIKVLNQYHKNGGMIYNGRQG